MAEDWQPSGYELTSDACSWAVVGAFSVAFPEIARATAEYVAEGGAEDGIYAWASDVFSPLVRACLVDRSSERTFWKGVEGLLRFDQRNIRNWIWCNVMEPLGPPDDSLMGILTADMAKEFREVDAQIRKDNRQRLGLDHPPE